MAQNKPLVAKKQSSGDAAVDGLFAGIAAGTLSAVFLILAGLISGQGPDEVLGLFSPGQGVSPFVGVVLHLATSSIYGLLFALLFHLLGRRWPAVINWSWLAGVVYGLLLMFLAETVIFSQSEAILSELPSAQLILFHVVYGLALGLTVHRMGRKHQSPK